MKATRDAVKPTGQPPAWRPAIFVLGVLLAALTWFTFAPSLNHEFVNYDDDVYVYEHPLVTRGLTSEGLGAAFTRSHAGNWHPLTTLSHMLDCESSGLEPRAHHRTNLVLHSAAVVLLFLALWRMTGAVWPSAAVAAIFAVHPLRVESVAWVAERKDLLSGLFFALTLLAYSNFARNSKSAVRYALVVVAFALGLMSKPMLVTLPFVLLLLDYWPLRRFDPTLPGWFARNRSLLIEKLSLLALAMAVCVVTLLVQDEARQSTEALPLDWRIRNALVSYVVYLGQLFYPLNLAVFYPYPPQGGAPISVLLALLVLVSFTWAAFHWRRKRPQLAVGWLWYLGMLVPVIGLVQVGMQAHADRYTYLPQIGLLVALVWTVTELSVAWKNRVAVLATAMVILLGTLTMLTRQQLHHWRDSEALWTRTIACTPPNAVAESNLANALFKRGQPDEALEHFRAALEINPQYADAHNGLGFLLLQQGRLDQAMNHFQQALQFEPESAAAHNNLGMALLQMDRATEAVGHLQAALKTQPDQAETHNNLGYALLRTGQPQDAVAHYRRALELKPDYAAAGNNLAWALATSPNDAIRNGREAVELAARAVQLTGGQQLVILRTLAAAYAEAGQFTEAAQTASRALESAAAQGNQPMAATLRREIGLYQGGQPLRDPAPSK